MTLDSDRHPVADMTHSNATLQNYTGQPQFILVNHSLYWRSMSPNGGGKATGAIADAINSTFGDFDTFQQKFVGVGTTLFSSVWQCLAVFEADSCDRPICDRPINCLINQRITL